LNLRKVCVLKDPSRIVGLEGIMTNIMDLYIQIEWNTHISVWIWIGDTRSNVEVYEPLRSRFLKILGGRIEC